MVAVVVVMALMAIALTVAVQTATFHRRRENELELIFRGRQFAEGVRLFRARNGRLPMSLEELVKAKPRAMRKAWKDPVTGKFDWVPVFMGQGGQLVGTGPVPGATPTPAPTAPPPDEDEADRGGGTAGGGDGKEQKVAFPATEARGPIVGVHSRSREESIVMLDGRSRHSEWEFTFETKAPGRSGGNQGRPTPTPRPR
jgi:type II secretory pathway pseudopilin PulG